jgi:hypothetical protein
MSDADEMTAELEQQIRDTAVERVAAGFEAEAEIVEGIIERFADEAEEDEVRPLATRATAEALAAHLAAQAQWRAPTDNDRLDRAFAALEATGIVARQNFTCCQTCGHGEIFDEFGGRRVRGYVFYHMQDTEAAVAGLGLSLAYGAASKEEDPVAIGHAIVDALRRERLSVEWDGSLERRISVAMEWRRRRDVAGNSPR